MILVYSFFVKILTNLFKSLLETLKLPSRMRCFWKYLFIIFNCLTSKVYVFTCIYVLYIKKHADYIIGCRPLGYWTLRWVVSSEPAVGFRKIFVESICRALFRLSTFTLYKILNVYYAKIDEY